MAAARGRSPPACAIPPFPGEGLHVVRCDIENLIKLQRFRGTTKGGIEKSVLGEQVNVARVELLSFVEIRLRSDPTGLRLHST